VYIGSSIDIGHRIYTHKSQLYRGVHHSIYLQRSWDKYGKDNFEFILIEEVKDSNEIMNIEQYWIDYFKSFDPNYGYNMKSKVDPRSKGYLMSDKARLNMSKAQTGRKHSKESIEKMKKIQKIIQSDPFRKKATGDRSRGERNATTNLKDAEVLEIKLLLNKQKELGLSNKEIYEKFGINRGILDHIKRETSWDHIKVEGYNPHFRDKKLDKEKVFEIKNMLVKGVKQSEIENLYGISSTHISAINNEIVWKEVIVDSWESRKNEKRKLNADLVKEIKIKLKNGISQKELALEYNVDIRTISGINVGSIWKNVNI
jgi:group I intron endonuclease